MIFCLLEDTNKNPIFVGANNTKSASERDYNDEDDHDAGWVQSVEGSKIPSHPSHIC